MKENNNIRKTIQKLAIRFGIVFFGILALLTYFSGTIDRMLLPKVSVTEVRSGTLSDFSEYTSRLFYTDVSTLTNSCDCAVDKVYVKSGETVKKGDKLIKYNSDNLEKLKKLYYNDVTEAQKTVNEINTQYLNSKDANEQNQLKSQLESAISKRDDSQKIYDDFVNSVGEDGIIYSDFNGLIIDVSVEAGSNTVMYQKLLDYAPENSELAFSWEMTEEECKDISIGSQVSISLDIMDHDTNTYETLRSIAFVSQITYMSDSGNYLLSANLPYLNLDENQDAPVYGTEITIKNDSNQISYSCIVPASAVFDTGNGKSVYVVEKTKENITTVKEVSVTVEDTNELYCAVSSDNLFTGEKIVYSTTKSISNNDRILIGEE